VCVCVFPNILYNYISFHINTGKKTVSVKPFNGVLRMQRSNKALAFDLNAQKRVLQVYLKHWLKEAS